MTEKEIEDYIKFMYNPDNSYNCENCPENEGRGDGSLPCGQYNCWVDCHCAGCRD